MRRGVLALVWMLLATPALGQTLYSVDVAVFAANVNPATTPPVAGTLQNLLWGQVLCGQNKATVTNNVTNPTEIWFDDPSNPTILDCQIPPVIAGLVYAPVTIGNGYRVGVRTRGLTTVSAWSVLSNPFDRVATAPAVATNVRVR
jgi:hypothetical protein